MRADSKLAKEIEANRNLLQSVFDTSFNLISAFESVRNKQGQIIDFRWVAANKIARAYSDLDKLEGQYYAQLFPGIKQTEIFTRFVEVVETGIAANFEVFYNKDGLNGWYCFTAVKLNDGLVATAEEITKRKTNEEEIKRQAHFISEITNATPDVIFVLDLQKMKVMYVNNRAKEIFPLHGEVGPEYDLSVFYKNIHPIDRPLRKKQVASLNSLDNGEIREMEQRIKGVDGNYRWYKIRDKIFERAWNGSVSKTIGFIQDIHEMKIAEEENILLGARHQEAVVQAGESERKRISEALHNDVGQVLFIAKLKAVGGHHNEAVVLIDEVIKKVRSISFELSPMLLQDYGLEAAIKDVLSKKLHQAGINYRLKVRLTHKKLPGFIEIAVFRIIQELVNNAVKHSKAGYLTLHMKDADNVVVIDYADNGIGFIANQQPDLNKGFGWRIIADKVQLLKGSYATNTLDEGGAEIKIRLPYTNLSG